MISGTGIDIIEVDRIRQAVQRWGDHFLTHVFCPEEIDYAQQHKDPFPHFAARFAAKEAVIKALGGEQAIALKSIRILKKTNGRPYCSILGQPQGSQILISISHTHHHAIASAIITSQDTRS